MATFDARNSGGERKESSSAGQQTDRLALPGHTGNLVTHEQGMLFVKALPADSPPLARALVYASQQPRFGVGVLKFLAQVDSDRAQQLWRACESILATPHPTIPSLVYNVCALIDSARRRDITPKGFEIPPSLIGKLILHHSSGPYSALEALSCFNSKELLIAVASEDFLGKVSAAFVHSFVMSHFQRLLPDVSSHAAMEKLLQAIVLKPEPESLQVCSWIRTTYQEARCWSQRRATAQFLWGVRDRLTQSLLSLDRASEGNFKICLLFPKEVPHPAIGAPPRAFMPAEAWLFDHDWLLADVYGHEYGQRLQIYREKQALQSHFFIHKTPCRIPPSEVTLPLVSKFDREREVLGRLSRDLGIASPTLGSDAQLGGVLGKEEPRSWISSADYVRYRRAQLFIALQTLAENFWAWDLPDRAREQPTKFLRTVVEAYGYDIAFLAPSIKKLGMMFYSAVKTVAWDEAFSVWRCAPTPLVFTERVGQAVALAGAFDLGRFEFHQMAVEALEYQVSRPTKELMDSPIFAQLVAIVALHHTARPSVEKLGMQVVEEYPNSLGAAMIVRYLFEVRSDLSGLQDLVVSQALSPDLPPAVWVSYAYAALGIKNDKQFIIRVREVLNEHYATSLAAFSGWDSNVRAAARIVQAYVDPLRVGDVSASFEEVAALPSSELEDQILDAVASIPGVSVQRRAFVSWGPAVDGVVRSESLPGVSILVLVDGEQYHSINGSWRGGGYDGHSLLATKILTRAGYVVLRLAVSYKEPVSKEEWQDAVNFAIEGPLQGRAGRHQRLVVNPDDDCTSVAGKVLLYLPEEGIKLRGDGSGNGRKMDSSPFY